MKKFFKSTAFKSVVVLLAIVLIAGALLAIFNDLLFVSPAERRNRMFAKLYGGDVTEQKVLLADDSGGLAYGNGTVKQAYFMSDGSYAVQATGNGGYAGGSITVWVILNATGSKEGGDFALAGIDRVVYESSDKQSYIGRFSEEDYLLFTKYNGEIASGALFGDDIDVIKTGASAPLTFGALKNAVNAALRYFRTEVVGEQEPAAPYAYAEYIDLANTTARVAGNTVEYSVSTKSNSPAKPFIITITVTDGVITEYAIETNGSTSDKYITNMPENIKDGTYFEGKNAAQMQALLDGKGGLTDATLQTGASRSVESCVRAAAFAVCNFQTILEQGGLNNE